VSEEPAALLQVKVTCFGSSSAGRDAGGGRADGLAREPKEEGEADSVLCVSKESVAVRSRQGAQPVGRASGGTDLDADANEWVNRVVRSNGDVSRLGKQHFYDMMARARVRCVCAYMCMCVRDSCVVRRL
jgi:hypothetical protein